MNMQKALALSCAAALLSWSPGARAAKSLDGNSLYDLCTDEYRVSDTSECLGYIIGIADVLALGDTASRRKACFDSSVGEQNILGIVKDYLRDAGDQGSKPAATLVVDAIAASFPCKQ